MKFCVDIWELDRFEYLWPTPDIPVLYRNFTADELKVQMKDTPVKHGVFIQVLNDKPEEASKKQCYFKFEIENKK